MDQHKKDKLLKTISAIENVKDTSDKKRKKPCCTKNNKKIQKSKEAKVYLFGEQKRH